MGEITTIIFLQIIAETFPISSSGHLVLAFYIFGCYKPCFAHNFYRLLSDRDLMYALHIPTVIILICLYAKRCMGGVRKFLYSNVILKIIAYTLVADSISTIFIIGLKQTYDFFPLWIGFIITACLLYSTQWAPSKLKRLTFYDYLILGLVQGVSAVPGISRLGSVYVAGRWLGLSGKKSFDVSWQLAFPLMLAAGLMGYVRLINVQCAEISIRFEHCIALLCAMGVSCVGFLVTYRMACRNVWWIWSLYMLIPIIISWIMWMGYCF